MHGFSSENMIYSILCTHVNANTIISHPPVRHITIEIGRKHILLTQIIGDIERWNPSCSHETSKKSGAVSSIIHKGDALSPDTALHVDSLPSTSRLASVHTTARLSQISGIKKPSAPPIKEKRKVLSDLVVKCPAFV